MTISIKQSYCPNCQRLVLGLEQRPNHAFHLILTIATGGIWLIVWVGVSLGTNPSLCSRCGTVTEFQK